MRTFYLGWEIRQTASAKFEAAVKCQIPSGSSRDKRRIATRKAAVAPLPAEAVELLPVFPLSWSQYVRLMGVENVQARAFYETEAIRGNWSVRELDRQISTRFYDRAVASKHQEAFLARSPRRGAGVTAEEEVRDPYVLEFLNLTDEYSESDLETALVNHLQAFLLEMGNDFALVGRQKRIRIGNSWYRIDLVLFHRGLRCLILIDLKTGAFTHADAGQMNLYLNYAREHLKLAEEADPVGIILCSEKDDAVVRYATGGISARVFASTYLTSLPNAETLRREVLTTRRALKARWRKE